MDELTIEILADGTIRATSGSVSAQNHASAEAFLRFVATLAGGKSTRTQRGDAHHHHHHDTQHTHDVER